jgi:hypothetical protein
MCTRVRSYGRAGWCGFSGRGVTNGIRADPRGCPYRSVCGERVHGACGSKMGHMAWYTGQHWTYGHTHMLRGKVPRQLLGSVCRHMHVHMGLGWDIPNGVWVGAA